MSATAYSQQASRQAYFQQQVQTASREQLLLMLYDGAIKFLSLARQGLEANDVEKLHNNLIKTQKILTELMGSLNQEIGGEAASNLYRLYEYYHHRLVHANMKKDGAAIDEVSTHLRDLRKTWAEAIKLAKQEAASEALTLDGESNEPVSEGAVRYQKSVSR